MTVFTALFVGYAAVFGLMVGSFLNVVIYRVPNGLSVVRPRSACPNCGHQIPWHENIPVLSWVALRARCSGCRAPISARYPMVETITATLFGLTAWHFAGSPAAVPAWLLLAALAVALSGIDIDTFRLPDPLVATLYLAGALLLALPVLLGEADPAVLVRAGIGLAASLAFHFVAWFIYPRGMGFGDVKLSGALGMYLAWLGWGPFAVGIFASYLVGLLVSVPMLLGRRRPTTSRSLEPASVETGAAAVGGARAIPFGPSMFAGAAVGVVIGQPLWASYLSAAGLA